MKQFHITQVEYEYLIHVVARIHGSKLRKKDIVRAATNFKTRDRKILDFMSLRGWLSSVFSLLITSHLSTIHRVKHDPYFSQFIRRKSGQLIDVNEKFVEYFASATVQHFGAERDSCLDEYNAAVEGFETLLLHDFFDGVFFEESVSNDPDYVRLIELLDEAERERLRAIGPPPPGPWDKDWK